jgi:hypothetical protein
MGATAEASKEGRDECDVGEVAYGARTKLETASKKIKNGKKEGGGDGSVPIR